MYICYNDNTIAKQMTRRKKEWDDRGFFIYVSFYL